MTTTTTTLSILRHARSTGEIIAAVDHLLQLGYSPDRAAKAVAPYVLLDLALVAVRRQVDAALASLSLADQEAAESAAASLRGYGRGDPRPYEWQLLRAVCIHDVTSANLEAAWDDHEHEAGDESQCDCANVDDAIEQATATAAVCEATVDAARAALRDSDEIRRYEIRDDNGAWHVDSTPADLDDDVAASVRDGDWDAEGRSWTWHGRSSCAATGEEHTHSVEIAAEVPDCVDDEHDWQSPHSVLGGLRENPGVWGKGGGVMIREVCAHCGRYRLIDTWADDGRGGHERHESYEDADEDSLAWVRERAEAA
jgi:hypothetical protein